MHSDYVRTACIQQQLSPQELWAPRTPSPARQRHTSKGTGPIVRTQYERKRRSMLTPPCRAAIAGCHEHTQPQVRTGPKDAASSQNGPKRGKSSTGHRGGQGLRCPR